MSVCEVERFECETPIVALFNRQLFETLFDWENCEKKKKESTIYDKIRKDIRYFSLTSPKHYKATSTKLRIENNTKQSHTRRFHRIFRTIQWEIKIFQSITGKNINCMKIQW